MELQIALLLCFVFVVVLFKIDCKARSEVSIALWIPSIWILILGSRMVSQWFADTSGSVESYESGSPVDSAILLALTVVKRGAYLGRSYDIWTGELIVTGVTNSKNSLGVLCTINGEGFTQTQPLSSIPTIPERRNARTQQSRILYV